MKFAWTSLSSIGTKLSEDLLENLAIEIPKRRNTDAVSLMKFLTDLSFDFLRDQNNQNTVFGYSSEKDIVSFAKSLLSRLKTNQNKTVIHEEVEETFEKNSMAFFYIKKHKKNKNLQQTIR